MELYSSAQAATTRRHRLSRWLTQQTLLTALEAQVQLAEPLAGKTSLLGTKAVILQSHTAFILCSAHDHAGERKSLSSSFHKEINLISLTCQSHQSSLITTILVASSDLTSKSPTSDIQWRSDLSLDFLEGYNLVHRTNTKKPSA